MPILNLKLHTAPDSEMAAKLAARLTDLTVTLLGKNRALTAVVIETAPQWFIAGTALAERKTFFLEIKITANSNTLQQKARYIKQVFHAMQDLLGELAPASYVVINETPAADWGYGGITQARRRDLKPTLL